MSRVLHPVAHWQLNGDVEDRVGTNHGAWSASEAYSFDNQNKIGALFAGSNGLYTQDTTDFDLSTLSVFTTITPTTISGDSRTIIHHGNGNANAEWHFRIYINSADNKIAVGIGNGISEGIYYSNSALVAGVKYRIGITHISDQTSIYINGILDRIQTTKAMSGYTAGQRLNFGARKLTASFDDWFIGTIRDAKIWNVALSADEAAQDFAMSLTPSHLWEAPLPIPQSAPMYAPVGAWGFDDGLKFVDVSGNGQTLTNHGCTFDAAGGFIADGASQYLTCTAAYNVGSADFFFNVWYKASATNSEGFITHTRLGSSQKYWDLYLPTTGLPRFEAKDGTNVVQNTPGTLSVNDLAWHMVTLYVDRTNKIGRIYVDAEKQGNDISLATLTASIEDAACTRGLLGSTAGTVLIDANIRQPEIVLFGDEPAEQIKKIYRAGVPADREGELLNIVDGYADRSLYNRTLTRSNVVRYPDEWMEFDGSSGSVSLADIADLTGDITIECEFYADGFGENNAGRILDNGKLLVFINGSGGNNNVGVGSSGSGFITSANNSVVAKKPNHLVITRTSTGTAIIYVNGVQSGEAQFSGTPAAGTTNLFAGNRSADDRTFDGKLRVRILKGIKTAAWAKRRYARTRVLL